MQRDFVRLRHRAFSLNREFSRDSGGELRESEMAWLNSYAVFTVFTQTRRLAFINIYYPFNMLYKFRGYIFWFNDPGIAAKA